MIYQESSLSKAVVALWHFACVDPDLARSAMARHSQSNMALPCAQRAHTNLPDCSVYRYKLILCLQATPV